jgi:putative mRNA 3-end processing factor
LRIEFLGACREVGRSAFVIDDNDYRFQLDSGVKVHDHFEAHQEPKNPVKSIITTHAHLDHSGALPKSFKHHPAIAFTTFPTIPLIDLLVEDSIKIARQEGKTLPISRAEVKSMQKNLIPLPYNKRVPLTKKSEFELFDAGHILGSAQVMYRGGKNVFYTGDFRSSPSRLHAGASFPKESVDALIIESSYAMRAQPKRDEVEQRFADAVQSAVEEGRTVLIPCFAIGRTQEVLMVLKSRGVKANIHLDGMGREVNKIYHDYPTYLKNAEALTAAIEDSTTVIDRAERKKIVKEPGVIIAGSGMLEGGTALSYIQKLNELGKGAVMLTGFQVNGCNGDTLLRQGFVKDRGKTVKIKLPVQLHNFSAHATPEDLRDAVKRLGPEKVFCVHGEPEGCDAFAKELREQGFDASAPRAGTAVEF